MKWAYEQIEEKNQFNIIEVTPLFIPFVFHNSRKTKRNNTRTREEKNEYQKIQPNSCAVWSLLLLLLLLLLWRRFFSSLVKNMNHRNIYICICATCVPCARRLNTIYDYMLKQHVLIVNG